MIVCVDCNAAFKNINEQILQMQEEKKKDGGSTALCAVNVGN